MLPFFCRPPKSNGRAKSDPSALSMRGADRLKNSAPPRLSNGGGVSSFNPPWADRRRENTVSQGSRTEGRWSLRGTPSPFNLHERREINVEITSTARTPISTTVLFRNRLRSKTLCVSPAERRLDSQGGNDHGGYGESHSLILSLSK